MEKTLKGKRFATVEEVTTASEEALNIKLQQFQRCFTQWEKIGHVYCLQWREFLRGLNFFVRNVNKTF